MCIVYELNWTTSIGLVCCQKSQKVLIKQKREEKKNYNDGDDAEIGSEIKRMKRRSKTRAVADLWLVTQFPSLAQTNAACMALFDMRLQFALCDKISKSAHSKLKRERGKFLNIIRNSFHSRGKAYTEICSIIPRLPISALPANSPKSNSGDQPRSSGDKTDLLRFSSSILFSPFYFILFVWMTQGIDSSVPFSIKNHLRMGQIAWRCENQSWKHLLDPKIEHIRGSVGSVRSAGWIYWMRSAVVSACVCVCVVNVRFAPRLGRRKCWFTSLCLLFCVFYDDLSQ